MFLQTNKRKERKKKCHHLTLSCTHNVTNREIGEREREREGERGRERERTY